MTKGPLINGIPSLAPGERRGITWGQYGGLRDALGSEPVRVIAHFTGKRSGPGAPSEHVVTSVIEVTPFDATDAAESLDRKQLKQLKSMAGSLRGISTAI